jgi:hypothetical protein
VHISALLFRALLPLGRQGEEASAFIQAVSRINVGRAVAGDGEKSGRPADSVDLRAERLLLAGEPASKRARSKTGNDLISRPYGADAQATRPQRSIPLALTVSRLSYGFVWRAKREALSKEFI